DLPAQGSADVGDQDVRDHERRDQKASALDIDPEVMEAVDRQRGAERDREEQDGEGPDQVEEAGDDPVDPTAVIPGEEREDEREQRADHRRADSDLQRVEAAIEEPNGDVTPLVVCAEEVAPPGVPELRSNRDASGHELPVHESTLRDDLNL